MSTLKSSDHVSHTTVPENGGRAVMWYVIAIIIILLDQWTKHIALDQLTFAESVPVLPFLNWTLLYNYGAAFSFLSDAGGWQKWLFTGLALVVSVLISYWLIRLPKTAITAALGFSLILGGAIGNVIDRINHGYVIDFIHVFYQDWHFPAFNIADSAITIGVILLLVDALFLEKRRQATESSQPLNL